MSAAGTCTDRSRGKRCRKVREHIVHALHLDDLCPVPLDDHHRFQESGLRRSGDGTLSSDPFVLTSVDLRRSDLTFLKTRYGSIAAVLRKWIAQDRGLTGARLKRHLARADPGRPVDRNGRFASNKPDESFLPRKASIEVDLAGPGTERTVEYTLGLNDAGEIETTILSITAPPDPEPPAPLGDDLDLLERLGSARPHCSCGTGWGGRNYATETCHPQDQHFPGCPDCGGTGFLRYGRGEG